jgi:hypothetical protein
MDNLRRVIAMDSDAILARILRKPTLSDHEESDQEKPPPRPACPVCGGRLVEIQAKLRCLVCHSIIETCCD